jgi:hypothetical protein
MGDHRDARPRSVPELRRLMHLLLRRPARAMALVGGHGEGQQYSLAYIPPLLPTSSSSLCPFWTDMLLEYP